MNAQPLKGRRKAQFFIITTVLISGALLVMTSLFTSSADIRYTETLTRHDGELVDNIAYRAEDIWWNSDWPYRTGVTVRDQSGSYLEQEPVPVILSIKRSQVNDDCSDIRVRQSGKEMPWNATTSCGVDTYQSETDALARYKMDTGFGSWANDSTGTGYDGELFDDPQWVGGRYGAGLEFDGTDDYVQTPSGVPVADTDDSSFSISAWIKTESDGAIAGKTYDAFADGDEDSNIFIRVNGGVVEWRLEYDGSNDEDQLSGNMDVADGNWHHVVGVRNGWNFLIYVDGELDANYTRSDYYESDGFREYNSALDPDTGIDIAHYRESNHFFDGTIDDVRIYDYALQPGQVKGIYQNGIGLNITVTVGPEEVTDDLYIYHGNIFAAAPSYSSSDLQPSGAGTPVIVDIGLTRTQQEVIDSLDRNVDRLDDRIGPSIDYVNEPIGCDKITFRSTFAVLNRDICHE